MTLLFFDGFDAQDAGVKWSFNGNTTLAFSSSTRYGTGYCVSYGSSNSWVKGITPSAKVTMGIAFKTPATFSSLAGIIGFGADAGSIVHTNLRLNTSGGLGVHRGTGSTPVWSSASGILTSNTWYYIEMMSTIADTGGIIEVRVNGTAVINTTGDTRNAGTSTNIDTVGIGNYTGSGGNGYFDDVYVINDQGSRNNSFLGDVSVQALFPTGTGSTTGLTPHGSSTNWQNVDEVPYSTADYNSSGTSNTKDLYAIADPASNTTSVFGVQTNIIAGKTAPGTGSIRPIIRVSGTTYNDTTRTLGPAPTWNGDVRETNPATSTTWNSSDIASLELGSEVI